jgi:hypothetical protein
VLRKKFVPKGKEVREEWEKIANEELHGLYALQITDNEMGGKCGTYGLEERQSQIFGANNSEERNYLEDLSIYHRIIIEVAGWAG